MDNLNDAGLMQEFREESTEHLAILEACLMALEDGPTPVETLNQMFRSAHTIKGVAGFLGMSDIGQLSHALETVLALARDGRLEFGKGVADVLLRTVDLLRRLLVEEGSDLRPLVRNAVDQLEGLLDPQTVASIVEEEEDTEEWETPFGTIRTSQFKLAQIPAWHRHLYLLCYENGPGASVDPSRLIALVRELETQGMVVDSEERPDGRTRSGTRILVVFSTHLIQLHLELLLKHRPTGIVTLERDVHSDGPLVTIPTPAPRSSSRAEPPQAAARAKTPPVFAVPNAEPDSRSPSSAETVRVRIDVLDRLMRLVGELVLVRNRQMRLMDGSGAAGRESVQRLDQVTAGIQDAVLRARMQPLGNVFSRFQRIVRDLGSKLGKDVHLKVFGGETELDRTLLEALADPLTHIVRNSCDHGIELPDARRAAGKAPHGTISVKASHQAGRVHVLVCDDGRGISVEAVRKKALERKLRTAEELSRMDDREIHQLVFLPGFSTAEAITDLSGRGVGMDVVKTSVERLGGTVSLESTPGSGTTVAMELPLTMAILPSLVVVSEGRRYAIPQAGVEELVGLHDLEVERLETAGHEILYPLRGALLPMVSLRQVLAHPHPLSAPQREACAETAHRERRQRIEAFRAGNLPGFSEVFAVLKIGESRYGLLLDAVVGVEEIVVEPLHPFLGDPPIYSGATVLGDGSVALILDAQGIARHAGLQPLDARGGSVHDGDSTPTQRLLLFRCGLDEQMALPLSCLQRVVRVEPDRIERSGPREYAQIDHRSVRIERMDRHLSVSTVPEGAENFLLLPKHADENWGILVSELLETGEYALQVEPAPQEGPLVTGTAILRGHRTLLLDHAAIGRHLSI